MTYKRLTNPLDSVVSVNYMGRVYELGPNASDVFEAAVAEHWTEIHEFLFMEDVSEEADETEKPKKSKTK